MSVLDLSSEGIIAPAVYDAGSAVLASRLSFPALFLSGFAAEASLLGAPDLGLITQTELVSLVQRITTVTEKPLIVDADTGFGGANSIHRTVRLLERAGAAAVVIEDQANPKCCPIIPDGRSVLDRSEAVDRIVIAAEARSSKDFKIMARTDADILSTAEQVERANLFLAANADIVFPMTMEWNGRPFTQLPPVEQMKAFSLLIREIDGPVGTVLVPNGMTAQHLFDIGMRVVVFSHVYQATASALNQFYRTVFSEQTDEGYFSDNPLIPSTSLDLLRYLGLDEMLERFHRFDVRKKTENIPSGGAPMREDAI